MYNACLSEQYIGPISCFDDTALQFLVMLIVSVQFSEDGYAIQEGNSLTVNVDSNFETLLGIPQLIDVTVLATVEVQKDANCERK